MPHSSFNTRRQFLHQLGLGTLSVSLIPAFQHCKSDTDIVKPFNPYTFRTNPNDPLILEVNTQAGERIEYFGTRRADGLPKSIDVVSYRSNANVEEATYCYFDAQKNISKIITEDGSLFAFSWTSATKSIVTFVSGDRANQLSTEIDLAKPASSGRVAAPTVTSGNYLQVRGGQPIRLTETQPSTTEPIRNRYARLPSQSVRVDVKKCGFPADAEVWVRMYKYNQINQLEKVGQYPAYRVTKGLYDCLLLPNNVATKVEVNPQQLCKWAIEKGVCSGSASALSTGLCAGLTAVAATYSGGAAARVALAACNKWVGRVLNRIVSYGCKQLIDDASATQKAYEFCDAQFENVDYRLWTGNLVFIAEAVGVGPKALYSKSVEIDGKSAYPTLSIDLGGSAAVDSLVLQPAKPVAHQRYTARATLECVPVGTRITMSVVGTDGYQDSTSNTVGSLSSGTYSVSLSVPGAKQAGINDTVTLVATLPDGKRLQQTASLVFG
jgi:hypothetical protein